MKNNLELTKKEQKLVDEVLFSYDKALTKVEKDYDKRIKTLNFQWLILSIVNVLLSFVIGFILGGTS